MYQRSVPQHPIQVGLLEGEQNKPGRRVSILNLTNLDLDVACSGDNTFEVELFVYSNVITLIIESPLFLCLCTTLLQPITSGGKPGVPDMAWFKAVCEVLAS